MQHAESGVELTGQEYRTLRRATETYREELILRFGAEAGLRPAEIARVRPADVAVHHYDGVDHYLLSVTGDDDGAGRTAYLPADVEHDLRQFASARGIDDDARLVPVTARRIQMIVGEVAERAAERSGNDRLADVSSRTLRRYFARERVAGDGLDPRVVRAIGGWERLASLDQYVPDADPDADDIAAAFTGTGLTEADRALTADTFRNAVDAAGHAVYLTDATGIVAYANDAAASLTGSDVADVVGRPQRQLFAEATALTEPDWGVTDVASETVRLTGSEGEDRRLRRTVAPVVENGSIEWYVAVLTEAGGGESGSAGESLSARIPTVVRQFCVVGAALAQASTREEIQESVCSRLTDGDAYDHAWVGEQRGDDVAVVATAGPDDGPTSPLEAADGPVAEALRTGEIQVVGSATDEALTPFVPDGAGHRTSAVVPVTDGETVDGVLGVGTPGSATVGDLERRVLTDVGRRVGGALTAADQQKLLLADTTVELELESTDADSLFVAASAEHDCQFTLDGIVPGEGGSLLYFVTLSGASAEPVLEWAGDHDAVADARLVRDYGESALLEFVVAGDDCAKAFVERGATVREMTAERGVQRIVGDVSPDADVREVVGGLQTTFPATELLTKRDREQPTETPQAFRSALRETLTEKQAAVLQAAYHAGYFEWPRGSTAEELADAIGITSPTLHNHLRRAQQKLLTEFFEGEHASPDRTPWNN